MPVLLGVELGTGVARGFCVWGLSVWWKKYGALLGAGFVWGEKCVFVRVGKAFLCTKKGYYIPLIYWAEVPNASAVGVSARIWGCAGEKRLPEVMCCLEREKKPPI